MLVKQEKVRVIEAIDGQLITQEYIGKIVVDNDCYAHANIDDDILKMVVVNRYHDAPIAVAFVKNFGLKNGAIASSVAHDSHNIIAVGVNDDCICRAVNTIIAAQGGLAVVDEENCDILPLPVAGLMSNMSCIAVAEKYTTLVNKSKSLGCTLHSPFMTLSFMALLVIPNLKLSDKGLFDAIRFQFCDIEIKD